jgi:hypothetical protein
MCTLTDPGACPNSCVNDWQKNGGSKWASSDGAIYGKFRVDRTAAYGGKSCPERKKRKKRLCCYNQKGNYVNHLQKGKVTVV